LKVSNSWLLLVSLLALAAIGASYVIYRRRVAPRGVLRFLAAASIVASFGGIRLEIQRSIPLAAYMLDVSQSCALFELSSVEAIRIHSAGMSPDSRGALVTFASTASVSGPVQIGDFSVSTDGGAGLGSGGTDLEAALKAAANLADQTDRVYLLSDGRANKGETSLGALLCSQHNLKVFPVVLNAPTPADAWISDIEAPVTAPVGEKVTVFIRAGANRAGKVKLSLNSGEFRETREVEFTGSGERRIAFQVEFGVQGNHILLAQAVAANFADTYGANNSMRRALHVPGPPVVLVYSARSTSAPSRILAEDENFLVETAKPGEIPGNPGELQDAAAVVLDDVRADDLSDAQMETLERYVRDLGGGLIVLGGPNSFGPGGYTETALEDTLPLWCNPERRRNVALVLMLDASGSMQNATSFHGEKMWKFRAALRAIQPAYRELKKGDEVAIITFATQPTVEMPMSGIGDGKPLRDALAKLGASKEPTGKTNIYPALAEALRQLAGKDSNERLLHVILLSDGRQTTEGSINLKLFKEAGVSVSTVATGDDPDRERLAAIAETTGGKYYEVANFDVGLRRAIMLDIKGLGGDLLREGQIHIGKPEEVEFLEGIGQLPDLGGIVLTAPKEDAHVPARTEDGEPVLAWWRLGLGRVIAFTGALDSKWGADFLKWGSLGKLVRQMVRWSAREAASPQYTLGLKTDGPVVTATLEALRDGRFENGLQPRAVFSCSEGQRIDAVLHQTGPGEYEAQVEGASESLCIVTAYLDTGEVLASTEAWLSASLERGPIGPDTSVLSSLAAATGGRILSEDEFLADVPEGRGSRSYDMWWMLLILAGVFFLADLVVESLLSVRGLK
jgi:Mg-chelatase subunit ChlD